ncbi:unnamed protein product [Paramecium sonneborni]|uniref:Transmembrane protein n=1 Tax=Paramecium sonneborni TaxID=65129 RepID=A0A8S1NN20_9CILI|nr:unnamed protein product [Paramecium sonneborni]
MLQFWKIYIFDICQNFNQRQFDQWFLVLLCVLLVLNKFNKQYLTNLVYLNILEIIENLFIALMKLAILQYFCFIFFFFLIAFNLYEQNFYNQIVSQLKENESIQKSPQFDFIKKHGEVRFKQRFINNSNFLIYSISIIQIQCSNLFLLKRSFCFVIDFIVFTPFFSVYQYRQIQIMMMQLISRNILNYFLIVHKYVSSQKKLFKWKIILNEDQYILILIKIFHKIFKQKIFFLSFATKIIKIKTIRWSKPYFVYKIIILI